MTPSFDEPLGRRSNLGHQVANQLLVVERLHLHGARLEPRRAGVDGLAVELHHAFLARIGVDAGEADRERRVAVGPNPAQPVEHRLPGLERHLVGLETPRLGVEAAPHFQRRDIAHCAATSAATGATGFDERTSRPPESRAVWLTCQSGTMPGKSSRWCAPRLSVRLSAASVTMRATSSALRKSSQSIRRMSKGWPSPAGRSPSADASSSMVARARASFAWVRNGPTLSAMVACKVWIMAAVLRSAGPPSAVTRSSAACASAGRKA